MPGFDGFDAIGDLNAFLEPAVAQDPLAFLQGGVPLPLDDCLTRLAASLTRLSNRIAKGEKTTSATLEQLKTPIDETLGAIEQIFVPNPDELDGATGGEAVALYLKQVTQALANPLLAFMTTQQNIFNQELQRLGDIFTGQDGYFSKVWDKVHFIFSTLFMNSTSAGSNLGGMVWYAVSEVLPAIDVELRYLKRMKRAVYTSIEETSKLPANMVPGLPNFWASVQMCEVDDHLERVSWDLKNRGKWNRSEWAQASEKICLTADALEEGFLPPEARGMLKGLTGWDDRQLNSLRDLKFLPNVKFRMKLIELTALNNFMQDQNRHVVRFHRNLIGLLDTIKSLASVDLGDVLSLIIDVMRNHIEAIRADMEAQAQGFGYSVPDRSGVPQPLNDTGKSVGAKPNSTYYNQTVFGALSAQVVNFTAVRALCFMFKQVQGIQVALEKLLDFNDKVLRAIFSFVEYYKGEDCGEDTGGDTIQQELRYYLEGVDARLRGEGPSDEVLTRRGKALIDAIETHEEWLVCIRSRLFFGRDNTFTDGLMAAANIISTVKNIYALVQRVPQLYDQIRNLDLLGLDQEGLADRSALDAVLQALQCMVLRCDNPHVTGLARLAEARFRSEKAQADAEDISLGSLDGVAAASRKDGLKGAINSFFKLYQGLQRLLNLDLTLLCDIDPAQRAEEGAPATTDVSLDSAGVQQDTNLRNALEAEQRQRDAGNARPFSG